jgi:hypothetical protein
MEVTPMRNDTHRPSVINPSDYEFVAFEYIKTDGDMGACQFLMQERATIAAHMAKTSGTYSQHEHGGSCHICGAGAVYTILFYHSLTNSYIRTGGDCADKLEMRFGDLDAFKKNARLAAGVSKGKRAAAAKWTEAGLARAYALRDERNTLPAIVGLALQPEDFVSEERERAAWIEARERDRRWVNADKLAEMIRTTEMYGTLSEKMVIYAAKLIDKHDAYAVVQAERAVEKEAAAPCPTGRVEITGVIVKVDERESQWGIVTKMLVKAAEGFMVWSTLPSGAPCERGASITFKATVKPSPDDPKFGFASRPIFKTV